MVHRMSFVVLYSVSSGERAVVTDFWVIICIHLIFKIEETQAFIGKCIYTLSFIFPMCRPFVGSI